MLHYYKILNVPPDAPKAKIKRAYYKLAKEYHPDVNPDPDAKDKFIEINEAYEILVNTDASRLRHYQKHNKGPTKKETAEAKRNAQRKAQMSAEQFRKYQLHLINSDKKLFTYMLASVLVMISFIVGMIYISQDPEKPSYDPTLPLRVLWMVAFPAFVLIAIILRKYILLNQDAHLFQEKFRKK